MKDAMSHLSLVSCFTFVSGAGFGPESTLQNGEDPCPSSGSGGMRSFISDLEIFIDFPGDPAELFVGGGHGSPFLLGHAL